MTDRLTFEVDNAELVAAISRALLVLEHPSGLMRHIGATLEQNINIRFLTKTDPDGNKWQALSPRTLARKKGRGSILELTGHGLSSLGYNAGDGWVEVGFGEQYMGFHETGTRRMPRRPSLMGDFNSGRLGAEDEADVQVAITEFLSDTFGGW